MVFCCIAGYFVCSMALSHGIVWYCGILIERYCMALQGTVWYFYSIVLHILYCIIMYCMIWYCFILYYTWDCMVWHGILCHCVVLLGFVWYCLPYNTMQQNTTQYNSMWCSKIHYNTKQLTQTKQHKQQK